MIKEELFLGRKGQSELIEKFLNSDKNNAALVYGRRRVGKTELIKHCLKKTVKKSTLVQSENTLNF